MSYCKPHTFSTDWRTSSQLEGNTGHVRRMWTSQLRLVTHVFSNKPKPFCIFQTAQTSLPRGQRKQAKLRGGIYCPESYIRMDSDSSSLTSADGSPVYLEVCTNFLRSWGRRVQQKPPHACISPATTHDKLCSTWDCGGSPGAGCQRSRWAVSQQQAGSPPQLLFVTRVFFQNGNGRFVGLPFFAYYRPFHVLYGNVYHSPHHFKVSSYKRCFEIMLSAWRRRKVANFERFLIGFYE